jgi:predicted amidophosphoribosyltransferase
MVENKYYCQNCNAEIKSTDTICPNCGKKLSEVGRRIEVTVTENISVFDAVKVEKLSPAQKSLIERFYKRIKDFADSKEIESITIDLGFIKVVIKGKKGTT